MNSILHGDQAGGNTRPASQLIAGDVRRLLDADREARQRLGLPPRTAADAGRLTLRLLGGKGGGR